MSDDEITNANCTGPLLVGLVATLIIAVAIAVYSSIDDNYFRIVIMDKVKIVFILGVLFSVFAQISVERFIELNGLTEDLPKKVRDKLKNVGVLSSVALILCAISSILLVNKYQMHARIIILYLGILVIMDALFYFYAKDAYSKQKDKYKLKVCKVVTGNVFLKVDIVCLLGTFIIYELTGILSPESQMNNELRLLQRFNDATHIKTSLTPHDVAWHNFLNSHGGAPGWIDAMSRFSQEMPTLVFGGAVGLQLFFSTWILLWLMYDWKLKLNSEILKVSTLQNGGAPVGGVVMNPTPMRKAVQGKQGKEAIINVNRSRKRGD